MNAKLELVTTYYLCITEYVFVSDTWTLVLTTFHYLLSALGLDNLVGYGITRVA